MCCVMPPASPLATRVRRIVSSSDVLPWSTWPITVTTGGRGSDSADDRLRAFGEQRVGIVELGGDRLVAHFLDHDHRRLLVEHLVDRDHRPSFISALMTSAAFTDILCARSATVIVSGTAISRTIGPDAAGAPASPPSSSWRRGPPTLGCRQPVVAAPPVTSPRSLSARRRAASSWNAVAALLDAMRAFFARLRRGAVQRAFGRAPLPSQPVQAPEPSRPTRPPSRLPRPRRRLPLWRRLPRLPFPSWSCASRPDPAFAGSPPAGGRSAPAPFFSSAARAASSSARDQRRGRDRRRRFLDRRRAARLLVALDEDALLAHLDLDRARLAGRCRPP